MKSNSKQLLNNINKIHTTLLGVDRIKKNLKLSNDINVVEYCKNIILDKNCRIYEQGKNYYCEINRTPYKEKITINANNYTIITAHLL
ncbi:DUF3781 domain-containing protein [Helicobacter sp. MIT 11-5569]|uniref:DUF3781 domain-containing protein n=1 Tax=Helicobacter sp. MIT 11-5569 TaxID=1548151 RepID=UPI00051FEDB8|nr:DUF3781 domain-containing protein [Helicobacter sp. MIT 11-5569]TLD81260.1 DUF3781 domain-containing protein [Helicobacter sp. MIT 11-5569]